VPEASDQNSVAVTGTPSPTLTAGWLQFFHRHEQLIRDSLLAIRFFGFRATANMRMNCSPVSNAG
jgi:hypothetical protein